MYQFISPEECDSLMESIDEKLAGKPSDGCPDLSFDADLQQLSVIGTMTWYRCDCGPISPLSGTIDILCDRCGRFRQVGPRLGRSPWPLYVACLRRVRPGDWFLWLKDWLVGHSLCLAEGGAYEGASLHSDAGAAYLGDSPKSAAGGAAYDGVSQHSRAGASAPDHILCIDQMEILPTGEIKGLNWIALPMPGSALF